ALDEVDDEVRSSRAAHVSKRSAYSAALRARLGANRARIQHLGDVGVVHQGQGLAFGLEAGDDLPRIHAGLDDLQSYFAANRLLLLGHEDDAEAAFADLLNELVRPDHGAGGLE